MKNVSSKIMMAGAMVLGSLVTSCNSGTTSTSSTTTTDSTTKTTTDTTKVAAPAAGKVATGTDITIHAVGNDMSVMHYDVSEIDAPANTKMKITLINDATDPSMQHNVVISRASDMDSVAMHGISAGMAKNFVPDDKTVIASSALAAPGKSVVLEFTTPASGDYSFFCTYPGHYQKMHGKLVVK